MDTIYKVAAVVIEDDKLLMVRKHGKDVWTNLGGKPEGHESDEMALKREVEEELGCKAIIVKKLGEFENKAVFDDAIVHINFFLCDLAGSPRIIDEELEEYKYISEQDIENGIKLPATITEQLIPLLKESGHLNWRST